MFTLADVVPWGRSFDEYRRMFALTEGERSLRILGCADGPASFNAAATRHGMRVTSCDPLYRWSAADVRDRIAATRDGVLEQARRNADRFVWDAIRSVDELAKVRMAAMDEFLDDFGCRPGERYVAAALPSLPFRDASFDLAICSHFLFLYTAHFDGAFHQAAIDEMCRVAREVRVFPLLSLDGSPSPYVAPILSALEGAGLEASIERVPYEFQRGANHMLRICRT